MDLLVFQIQLAATLYMMGLIWFVQLVHYPMFANVPEHAFGAYERVHQQRTAWAVSPMIVELAAAVAYLWYRPSGHPAWLAWLGLAIVLAMWGSTFLWFGPAHGKLGRGFDAELHRRLVRYNWARTAGWSLRGLLLTAAVGWSAYAPAPS